MTENKFIKKKTADVQVDPLVLAPTNDSKSKNLPADPPFELEKTGIQPYESNFRPNFWIPLVVPVSVFLGICLVIGVAIFSNSTHH